LRIIGVNGRAARFSRFFRSIATKIFAEEIQGDGARAPAVPDFRRLTIAIVCCISHAHAGLAELRPPPPSTLLIAKTLRRLSVTARVFVSRDGGPAQPNGNSVTQRTRGEHVSVTGKVKFFNETRGLLSVGSCNAGNGAPTNGTGGTAFAGECWIDTTANPWVFNYTPDGTHWVEFGTLNTSSFVWTPYLGASPVAETAPLSGSLAGGVLTIALQYDSNFTSSGANQLAFANIASGSLLANGGANPAEPTATTPSAWLDRWCSSAQFNFPQAGASSWACGTISGLLAAGTGISLSGTGQVTIALSTPVVVANGGTGQTSLTANAFLTGNGTGGVNQVALTGLVLGNGASAPAAYGGANCTDQVVTALSAAGTATCSSLTNAYLTAGAFANITGVGTLTTGTWNAATIAVGFGGTGQTTAAAARASSGLNIDECTSTGSSAYTIASTDRCVYHTSLTAAVTDTLPAAASVNPGQLLIINDFRGAASASNTITLQRGGSDTINGSTSAVAINSQYGWSVWMSDGVSRWTYQQGGSGSGSGAGTVTNVGIAAGATIALSGACTITTSGTCTVAGRTFQYFVVTSSNASWNIAANFGYTPSELFMELWGGGASGSGEAGGANTDRGSGGGGAQYAFYHYTGTMDAALNIAVGAGGTSCTSACGGVSGGATSVVGTNLGTVSAAGGVGSACGGPNCAGGAGGTGGSVPNAANGFTIAGQGGGSTFSLVNYFGVGGDAPRGGQGAKINVSTPGGCPGGGGSGENHTGGGSGAGCAGEVIIWGR
jgi:hypothetical protein